MAKFWSGRDVKSLRNRLGLNQTDFANQLNVTQTAVTRWETNGIPEAKALRIVRAFGMQKALLEDLSINTNFACDIDKLRPHGILTGESLSLFRKSQKLTQAEFAVALQTTQFNISQWENLDRLPSVAVDKISIFLSTVADLPAQSVDDLIVCCSEGEQCNVASQRARVKSMVDRVPDAHLPSLEIYISGLATDGPRAN